MISKLTTALLILGLLSLVTARPVSHESAKKQDTSTNDLLSDKELEDLLERLERTLFFAPSMVMNIIILCAGAFPSSNAKEQGFSASITLPDGRTFEWAKKQGRRIPFSKGETQGIVMTAAYYACSCGAFIIVLLFSYSPKCKATRTDYYPSWWEHI
jgi:hypothetical protein